ncbi:MAG TPA: flagellar biosynthesis protein FlgD [Clostridium sp.]|jgi:flagellar basal-body rod modification protein FlgD|nr:flagellar biosynthesis protein FlgD [Clostridium sp.]
MDVSGVNSAARATEKGTRIVKAGEGMDKNAFLRILAAELTNQDPTNAPDSTQFVSQMAQFASLEQISNLNTTMTMSSANSIIGKAVTVSQTDLSGNNYAGIVRAVTNNFGNVKVTLEVEEDGFRTYKDFAYEDVKEVIEVPDNRLDAVNENMLILTASALIGKKAEFNSPDQEGNNYVGTVKGVYIQDQNIMMTLLPQGSENTVDLPYSQLIKVEEA